MLRIRSVCGALALAAATIAFGTANAPATSAARPSVSAWLDGRMIPLKDVAKHYCDDFSYPVITCSADPAGIEARASLLQATAVDYLTIYDSPLYGGAFMNVSQDYSALSFIGWNDRISSFKARNAQTGKFWTDWFYGGVSWAFCCNQQVASLGSYDDTFSSIQRT